MLFLLWFLLMKVLQSNAIEIVTVSPGESVLLGSRHLQGLKPEWDVRWTHPHLLMSLNSNEAACHHKRCRMRKDGVLEFEQVQRADAGFYRMEVFDASGLRQMVQEFKLEVKLQGNTTVQVCVSVLLLLFIIITAIIVFAVIRRRRSQTPSGRQEEDVYMIMRGDKQEKQGKEEESHYVRFHPVVSTAKPITEQKTGDEEDIYV